MAETKECPLCKTRELLEQMMVIVDQIPEIGAELYDDTISEIANNIDNAKSTFQCYCDTPVDELPAAIQAQIREFPR